MTTWAEERMQKLVSELEALNEAGAKAIDALERLGEQEAAELAVLREQRDAGLFAAMRIYTDELRQLRAMRDGLVRIRESIAIDPSDVRWHIEDIDALLALVSTVPA